MVEVNHYLTMTSKSMKTMMTITTMSLRQAMGSMIMTRMTKSYPMLATRFDLI